MGKENKRVQGARHSHDILALQCLGLLYLVINGSS